MKYSKAESLGNRIIINKMIHQFTMLVYDDNARQNEEINPQNKETNFSEINYC